MRPLRAQSPLTAQELSAYQGQRFVNTLTGLYSTARPSTSALQGERFSDRGYLLRSAPDFRPVRTSRKVFHTDVPSAWDREQEARRRRVLLSMAHCTGFMGDRIPAVEAPAERAKRERLRQELRNRLRHTPTAARKDARLELSGHPKLPGPLRTSVSAARGDGVHAATPDVVHVNPRSVGSTPEDVFETMELSTVDFLTTFYDMDSEALGNITRSRFEDAMLSLSYSPQQAARMFDALDVDRDGVISMHDWTASDCAALAQLLIRRLLRHKHQLSMRPSTLRPRTTMTNHKLAMELMLAKLGVTAKSDFINLRNTFMKMDEDGSGDVDAGELGATVEKILRQKISEGAKKEIMRRFDKNGDGKISIPEFIDKIIPSPLTLLYSYLPSSFTFA